MSIVIFSFRTSSASIFLISRIPSGSRPLIGSSKTIISGLEISDIASPSRCLIPIENFPAAFLPVSLSPTYSRSSSTLFSSATPRRYIRYLMFSCAVILYSIYGSSMMKLILLRLLSTSSEPKYFIVPESGSVSPAIIFIMVVLPAPLGPISP